jgi:hypothetical protein
MIRKSLVVAALVLPLALGQTSPSNAATLKVATFANNNQTLKVSVGQSFRVTLDSTYWEFSTTFNKNVLSSNNKPSITLIQPGPTAPQGCQHPGSGCGSISFLYKVKSAGTTTITAVRSSCGEAIQCTPANSKFKLTILAK